MGIASGAFVPPSSLRDAGSVEAPMTGSAHACGVGCEIANGSTFGLGALALVIVAASIGLRRWWSGRRRSD
jgi:hypothetical protein